MKKILTLALLAAALLPGCNRDGPETPGRAAYYGTWKIPGENSYVTVSDNGNRFVVLQPDGDGYTIERLTWTPVANTFKITGTKYPTGYKITGELKELKLYLSLPKADGTDGKCAVGDTAVDFLYISGDSKLLMLGNAWADDHGDGWPGFEKQP